MRKSDSKTQGYLIHAYVYDKYITGFVSVGYQLCTRFFIYKKIRGARGPIMGHGTHFWSFSFHSLFLSPVGCPAKNRTSATMACRRMRLRPILCLFLFFCLISHLLVLSCIFNALLSKFSSVLLARREAGLFWCHPPVWDLRAVIWFHLSICSLVILPSPFASFVFSFPLSLFCVWLSLLSALQKCL